MNRYMVFIIVSLLGVFLTVGSTFAQPITGTELNNNKPVESTSPGNDKATTSRNSSSTSATQTSNQDAFQISKLIDANVKGTQGQDLGTVKDVIISDKGQAEYIVLSKGDFLGVGGDLVPVPYDVAQPSRDQQGEITLNISKQVLDQAPTVADNDLKSTSQWENDIRGYFGGPNGQSQDRQSDVSGSHNGMSDSQNSMKGSLSETRNQPYPYII